MTARSLVKTERLPKYVRTKRAKGRLYYYFEMDRPEEGKPTLRRLPHISMPHFHAECRTALLERLGLREPPEDELADLFPGTGAVTEAWRTWRGLFTLPVAA